MRQVHGTTAHTDDVAPCEGAWPDGDLLATDRTDVALTVRTADCVPLLYADVGTGAVSAVHAGWRGTVAGAAARMVEVMASRGIVEPPDSAAPPASRRRPCGGRRSPAFASAADASVSCA